MSLAPRTTPRSRWKEIARTCLRAAAAVTLPLFATFCTTPLLSAQGPFQFSVDDVFDEPLFDLSEREESLVRFRGGMTYLDKRVEDHTGGTYGLDGIIPVDDNFGLHWAQRVNQFSGGTQYLTTFGAYRQSDPDGDLSDKIGASVVADLFHDTRVSDLWLAQLRGQVGIATSENSAIGAAFTIPLNDNHAPALQNPNTIVPYTAVESIGIYATSYIDDFLIQGNVGYRKLPDSLYAELTVRKTLVEDKLFAYANTNYVADSGGYGIWAGVEVRLGGNSACGATNRRSAWDDPTIFNTFNYGENSFYHNTNDGVQIGSPPPEEEEQPR